MTKEELKEQDIRLNRLCFDYQEKEKRITELEAQIEKMKSDVELARDNANKTEDWETFSVLNSILDDWEVKEND